LTPVWSYLNYKHLPLSEIKVLAVSWGGCHKLYICETRDDIEAMLHCGYEVHDMKDLKPLWAM